MHVIIKACQEKVTNSAAKQLDASQVTSMRFLGRDGQGGGWLDTGDTSPMTNFYYHFTR